MFRRNVDLCVISDIHLGTYSSHAIELLNYLKNIEPEILIINGDFIDGWEFRKKYFPTCHLEVIQEIITLADSGTKVYYIAGNHDDMMRKFVSFKSGNIFLRNELVFTLHGRKYWIFHGDVFDVSIAITPWLAKLGGRGYSYLLNLNRILNYWRIQTGKGRFSLANRMKQKVKKAVKYVRDFEKLVLEAAVKERFDYVICGHIHVPKIKKMTIEDHQICYMNSGDWVENLTALEYKGKEWSIYIYDSMDYSFRNPKLEVKSRKKPKQAQVSHSLNDPFQLIIE